MESESESPPDAVEKVPDKPWEWIPCIYDLKQSSGEMQTTRNLAPTIMLTLPSEQNTKPKMELVIENSQNFIFSQGIGWNWHKSWNIPDIHCYLDLRDPTTNERLLPPSKLYAELYVVRAVIQQMHSFHLVDVGVQGANRVDFENNRCLFTGMKFTSTSYNHEGSQFHLVIVVYLHQSKSEPAKILESQISPAIFVDSRKSARDTQKLKAQKLSSFVDPFPPETLDQQYVKRDSKNKGATEEIIENNIEGLSNFFGAPNIRHKSENMVMEVTKSLQSVTGNSKNANTSAISEDKLFLLSIDQCHGNPAFKGQKQIVEFLEPIQSETLQVIVDAGNIPQDFLKITDLDGIKEAYCQIFAHITSIKPESTLKQPKGKLLKGISGITKTKKDQSSKQGQDDNPSGEEDSQSPIQQKRKYNKEESEKSNAIKLGGTPGATFKNEQPGFEKRRPPHPNQIEDQYHQIKLQSESEQKSKNGVEKVEENQIYESEQSKGHESDQEKYNFMDPDVQQRITMILAMQNIVNMTSQGTGEFMLQLAMQQAQGNVPIPQGATNPVLPTGAIPTGIQIKKQDESVNNPVQVPMGTNISGNQQSAVVTDSTGSLVENNQFNLVAPPPTSFVPPVQGGLKIQNQ